MLGNETSGNGRLSTDDDSREKHYSLGCEPTETVALVLLI